MWSLEDLERDRAQSETAFAVQRIHESGASYAAAFDRALGAFTELFATTSDLRRLTEPGAWPAGALASLLSDQRLSDAARYVAAPPISTDDLKVVAGVASLSRRQLSLRPDDAVRVAHAILASHDPRRFPWLRDRRAPTASERDAALMASAALLGTQRTATERRKAGKVLEESVAAALIGAGLRQVPPRPIDVAIDAPGPGEFCAESAVAGRKADLVVGLYDRRTMPLECKVSNSTTNSVKRLNNDAAVKAVRWLAELGTRQVVPTAVLAGVYNTHNLVDAQEHGLTLFWAHDLDALVAWIASTR